MQSNKLMLTRAVNEILGDHNVDKQMTDSRGEVLIHNYGLMLGFANGFLGCILDG